MSSILNCDLCGGKGELLRCSRCRQAHYCSKQHQTQHWSQHKSFCKKNRVDKNNQADHAETPSEEQHANTHPASDSSLDPWDLSGLASWDTSILNEGSSESEILSARTEILSPIFDFRDSSSNNSLDSNISNSSDMPTKELGFPMAPKPLQDFKNFSEISLVADNSLPPFLHRNGKDQQYILEEVCRNVIRDMDAYGVCVVDNFLGPEKGLAVLEEVTGMYSQGVFKDGQLVSAKVKNDLKTIRGDQITWIDGKEKSCENISVLISQVDNIIIRANKMSKNGKLGEYNINGRTKAMVACYPGYGSHYVKHVDNPNRDGRCITAIYYLNREWDIKRNGGLLRIFPEGWRDQVADIEPLFDRILFFWSDRRNPHEVQPAFKTRYAITLWYFDALEREEACKRFEKEKPGRRLPVM